MWCWTAGPKSAGPCRSRRYGSGRGDSIISLPQPKALDNAIWDRLISDRQLHVSGTIVNGLHRELPMSVLATV